MANYTISDGDCLINRKSNEYLELPMTLLNRLGARQQIAGMTSLSFSLRRDGLAAIAENHDTSGITVDETTDPTTYGDLTWRGGPMVAGTYIGAIEAMVNSKPISFPEQGNIVLIIGQSPVPT